LTEEDEEEEEEEEEDCLGRAGGLAGLPVRKGWRTRGKEGRGGWAVSDR